MKGSVNVRATAHAGLYFFQQLSVFSPLWFIRFLKLCSCLSSNYPLRASSVKLSALNPALPTLRLHNTTFQPFSHTQLTLHRYTHCHTEPNVTQCPLGQEIQGKKKRPKQKQVTCLSVFMCEAAIIELRGSY